MLQNLDRNCVFLLCLSCISCLLLLLLLLGGGGLSEVSARPIISPIRDWSLITARGANKTGGGGGM